MLLAGRGRLQRGGHLGLRGPVIETSHNCRHKKTFSSKEIQERDSCVSVFMRLMMKIWSNNSLKKTHNVLQPQLLLLLLELYLFDIFQYFQ